MNPACAPLFAFALLFGAARVEAFQFQFWEDIQKGTVPFTDGFSVGGTITLPGTVGCGTGDLATQNLTILVRLDGVDIGTMRRSSYQCEGINGVGVAGFGGVGIVTAWFGSHTLTFVPQNQGVNTIPVEIESRNIVVTPQLDLTTPNGVHMLVGTRASDYYGRCYVTGSSTTPSADVPALPATVAAPLAYLNLDLTNCAELPYSVSVGTTAALAVLLDRDLPVNARLWAFGVPTNEKVARWHAAEATIEGRRITANIQKGNAFDRTGSAMPNFDWAVSLAIVVDPTATPRVGGLYWAGSTENGWGMTIAQNEDRLFGALFIYDQNGAARWLATNGGTWSADNATFTTGLLRPQGTPASLNAPATDFIPGPNVGTAVLHFDRKGGMRIDATIDGVAISKAMSILQFASPTPRFGFPRAAVYWGGPGRAGWGVFDAQQQDRDFLVWYTYDGAGMTSWYFASDLQLTDWILQGGFKLYDSHGPVWPGAPYDAGKLILGTPRDLELRLLPDSGLLHSGVAGFVTLQKFNF